MTSAPNWGLEWLDCFSVKRVRELHISSPILAAKSPFFYKVNPSFLCLCFCPLCVSLTFVFFF